MSKLRSKCCGAKVTKIYYGVIYKAAWKCKKCGMPCKVEEEKKCQHKITIAINEEGHAGIYCVDCDEQLEKEC